MGTKQKKNNFTFWFRLLKFMYSEKATNFCKISSSLLSYVEPVKSKEEISSNFVAFSEYMNFNFYIIHTFLRDIFRVK